MIIAQISNFLNILIIIPSTFYNFIFVYLLLPFVRFILPFVSLWLVD